MSDTIPALCHVTTNAVWRERFGMSL